MRKNLQGKKVLAVLLAAAMFLGNTDAVMAAGRGTAEPVGQVTVVGQESTLTGNGTVTEPGDTDGETVTDPAEPAETVTEPADGTTPGTELTEPADGTDPADGENDPAEETKPADGDADPAEDVDATDPAEEETAAEEEGLTVTTSEDAELLGAAVVTRPIHVYYIDGSDPISYKLDVDGQQVKDIYDEPVWDEDFISELGVEEDTLEKDTGYYTLAEARKAIWEDRTDADQAADARENRIYRIELVKAQTYVIGETDLDFEYYSGDEARYKYPPEDEPISGMQADPAWKLWKQVSLKTNGNRLSVEAEKWAYVKIHRIGTGVEKKTTTLTVAKNAYDYGHLIFGTMTRQDPDPADEDLTVHVPADLIVNGSGDVVIRPDAECKGAITGERIRTSVDLDAGIPTGPEVSGKLTATGELILSAGTTVKDVVSKKRTVIGGVYAAGYDPEPNDTNNYIIDPDPENYVRTKAYADEIYADSIGLMGEGNNIITFSGTLDLGGEIVSNFYMYDPDYDPTDPDSDPYTPQFDDDEVFYSPVLHYHFIDEHPDPAINLTGTLKAQRVTDPGTGKADAVYDGPFLRFSKQHSTVDDEDHEKITGTEDATVKFETHDVLGKLMGALTAVNDLGTTVAITKDNIDEWIEPSDRMLPEGCAILDGVIIKVGVYHYQLYAMRDGEAEYSFHKGFHTLAAMSDHINRDGATDTTKWRVGFEKDEDLGTIANLPDKGADLRLLGKGDRVRLKLTGTTTLKTNMTLENIILEVNGDLNSKKELTLSGGTDTSTDPATALDVKGNIRFTDGKLILGEAGVNPQKPVTVYSTGAVELKDLISNLKGNRIFFPGTDASTRMKITGALTAGGADIDLEEAPNDVAPVDNSRYKEGGGAASVEGNAVQLILTGCARKTTDKPIPKEFYDYSMLADAFLSAPNAGAGAVTARLVVTNGFNGTEDPNKVRDGEQLFYWLLGAAGGNTYRIARAAGAGIRLFSLGTGDGGTDVEIFDADKQGNYVPFETYKQVVDCIEKQRKPAVFYEIRLEADVEDNPLVDGAILPPVEKTLAGTIKKYSALPIPNSCKGVTIRGPQGAPKKLVYEGNLDIKGKTVVFDNVILSPMTGKANVAGSSINLGAGKLTLIDSQFNFADEYKRFSRIQGSAAAAFTLTTSQPVDPGDRVMLYVTLGISGVGSFTIERHNLTVGSGVGEHSPMAVGNLTATESRILVKTLTATGAQGVRLDDATVEADQNSAVAAITISKNLAMRNKSEVRARTGAVTVSGQATLGVSGEPGVAPSMIYAGTNVTLGSLVVNSTGNKIDLGEANGAKTAKLTITGTATVTSRVVDPIELHPDLADSKYKAYRKWEDDPMDPDDDIPDTERYRDAVLFKHGQYCTQKETTDGHGHSTTTYAYDELPDGVIATAKNVVDPRIFVAVEAYEENEADMIYRIVKKSGGNLVLRHGIPRGVVLWSDSTGKAEYEDVAAGAWTELGEFDSLAEALVNITERNVKTSAYCVELKEEVLNARNEVIWSATPVVGGIYPTIVLPSALKRLIIAGYNDPAGPTTIHFTGTMKQGSAMELRNLILESDSAGTITAGAYDLRIVDCVSTKARGLCNISAGTAKNVSVEGGGNGKFEIAGSFQVPAGTLTLRNQEVYAKYGVTAKNLTLGDEEDAANSVTLKVEGVSNITATTVLYNGAKMSHTGPGAVTFYNIENHAANVVGAASNAISYALSGTSGLSINGRVRKYALGGGAAINNVPEIRLLFPVSNGSDYIWKYFPLQPKKDDDDDQQPRGMVAPETYLAKMPLAKTGDFQIRLGDDVTDDDNIVNQDLTIGEEFAAKANGALYVVQEIHSGGNRYQYGWRNNLVTLMEFDEDGEVPNTYGNYIDLSQAVAQINLAGGLNRSFRIEVGFGQLMDPGTDVAGDAKRQAFNAETGQKDGEIPVRKVLDTNVLDEQPHGRMDMPERNKACSVVVAAYQWPKNDPVNDPDPMAILEFSGDVTAYGGGVLNDRRRTNVDGGIAFSNLILKPVGAENAENGTEVPAIVNLRLYRSDGARYAKPTLFFSNSVVSHAGGGIRQIQGTAGATRVWVSVYTPGDDPEEDDVRQEVRILGGFTGIDRVTVANGLLMTGGTSACDTLRLVGAKAEYAALGATTVGKLLVDQAARGTAVLTTKNDKTMVFTLTGYAMTPDEKWALPPQSVAVRTAVSTQTADGMLTITKASGAKETKHNDLIYADQPREDGGEDLEYHKGQTILLRALKAEALIFIAERILNAQYCADHWITADNIIAYKDADNYVMNANKNDMAVYITGGDPEVAIYAATWWDAVTLADLLPRDKDQKLVFSLLQALQVKEQDGNEKKTQRYTTTGKDGSIGTLVFPKYAKNLVVKTADAGVLPVTMEAGSTAALVFAGQIKPTCPVEFKNVQLYETMLTDADKLIKKKWDNGFVESEMVYDIARDDGISLDAGAFDVSFEDTTTITVVKGKKDNTPAMTAVIPTAADGIYPWYAGVQDVLSYDPDDVADREPMQFYGITGAAGKIKFTGRDVFLRSGNLTAQNLILEQTNNLGERQQVTLGNGLVDVKNLTVKGSAAIDNHARRPWTWSADESYSKNDANRSKLAVNAPQAMKLGTVIGDEVLLNSLTLDYNFSKAQYKTAATMLTISETADRITNLALHPWLFDSERTGDYKPMGAEEIVYYNTYAYVPKAWQKIAAMPKIFTSGVTFRYWSPADDDWLSIGGTVIGDPPGTASLYKYNQGLYMTSKQPVVRVYNTDGLYDTQFMSWDAAVKEIDILARKVPNPDPKLAKDHKNDIWDSYTMELLETIGNPGLPDKGNGGAADRRRR